MEPSNRLANIQLNKATISFDDRFTLSEIDWTIEPDQHWVITGTNGAGKSALAAALAFVPLTFSVFWSSLAFVLIGGGTMGTLLTLLFLPALCALVLGRQTRSSAAAGSTEAAAGHSM